MNSHEIFNRLWLDYILQNPSTKKIFDLFTDEGEHVVNDHIALRTFRHPQVGIDQLALVFLRNNYELKGEYRFEKKHLFARHFEHKTNREAPRVFISELLTDKFSHYLQQVVKGWIHSFPLDRIRPDELVFSGNQTGAPSFTVYQKLRQESEYAAWLYVNGFRANHFTVSVNHLKKYDTIQKVNAFLKSHGFQMNDAGGEIQGSPQELLEQSSIKASMVKFDFSEGDYEIPGCFYEFARRYPDADGNLYGGFIAKSADKIFESTHYYSK